MSPPLLAFIAWQWPITGQQDVCVTLFCLTFIHVLLVFGASNQALLVHISISRNKRSLGHRARHVVGTWFLFAEEHEWLGRKERGSEVREGGRRKLKQPEMTKEEGETGRHGAFWTGESLRARLSQFDWSVNFSPGKWKTWKDNLSQIVDCLNERLRSLFLT